MTRDSAPNVQWVPLETEPAPEKRKPAISIEWAEGIKRDEATEKRARELMSESIDYLKQLYGDDYFFPVQFLVKMTKRSKHGARGVDISLATDSMKKFDDLDEPEKDQERSLIVHEVVHNLRDEEDLSMLVELIYMIEKGHLWRLTNLKKIRKEGGLSTPYETGLSTIATWLGTSIDDLLDESSPKNLGLMKDVFREKIKLIIEETSVILR
ncbi:hypothetical protein HY631_00085 [Candidatus Uhrbacteria bacterium]|nr:hypothetical protein [Candidatus Uhrbacteria bacterium]